MAVATITIRQLLQRITDGEIRIPAFQREFIWEPDRVQFLMDSIFKGYPIGTVLFWRTKEKLSYDRDLGPFALPEPKKEYPIDYVLDGQQRLTSIFSTFQTELKMNPDTQVKWVDIYFDLSATASAQDSQFVALEPDESLITMFRSGFSLMLQSLENLQEQLKTWINSNRLINYRPYLRRQ